MDRRTFLRDIAVGPLLKAWDSVSGMVDMDEPGLEERVQALEERVFPKSMRPRPGIGGMDTKATSIWYDGTWGLFDNGDVSTLPMDSVHTDTLGAADLSNDAIVIPEDGVYLLDFACSWADTGDSEAVQARIDETGSGDWILRVRHKPNATDWEIVDGTSGVRQLSEGDTLKMKANQTNGTNVSVIGNESYLWMSATQLSVQ